jgi:hypothetical protein
MEFSSVLFVRSICLTAHHLTENNAHLFELETAVHLRPHETLLMVSRNASPATQTVFRHHHLRRSSKLFYLGLSVTNSHHVPVHAKANTLVRKLLRRYAVEVSLHVLTARDLLRAEIATVHLNNH